MNEGQNDGIADRVHSLPLGYSEVLWKGFKYGLTRTDFNQGKSTKIFAEQLGGSDFISFNYYFTLTRNSLKPCEMPEAKVVDFLRHFEKV